MGTGATGDAAAFIHAPHRGARGDVGQEVAVSGPRPGLAGAAQPGGLRPWRGWPRFLAPGPRGSPSEELVSRLCPWRWAVSLAGWSGALVWDSLAPEAPSRVFVRSPRQNLWASHLPKCYLKTLVLVSNTTKIAYFRPRLNTGCSVTDGKPPSRTSCTAPGARGDSLPGRAGPTPAGSHGRPGPTPHCSVARESLCSVSFLFLFKTSVSVLSSLHFVFK